MREVCALICITPQEFCNLTLSQVQDLVEGDEVVTLRTEQELKRFLDGRR